jgi:hypothetical protein
MCANQDQKDLFSAFGTLILERLATAGPSFLASPRNEAKEGDPTKHEGPCAADNRVGGRRDWLAASLLGRNPAPLVPRSGVFQGDIKALCKERGYCIFWLFSNEKTNCLAHMG